MGERSVDQPQHVKQLRPLSQRSLTDKTVRGVSWMMLQTICTQIVNVGGFFVLGWLLAAEAFGLFALVMSVATFAAISKQFGIRAVIIRRFDRFSLWSNAAVWMTLLMGIVATLVMVLAAPIASVVYGRDELLWLVLIFALSILPNSLSTIPEAALAARMRFKLLAAIEFSWISGVMVLTVLLALLDFGVYSFVLPYPIVQSFRFILVWRAAGISIRRTPQFRRWRYLIGDSARLTISNVSSWIVTQCDYIILGLFHGATIVGLYFFAYRLSVRVIVLFVGSFRNVLMPALTQIKHDPMRQTQAFVRAARMLAVIGAPVCLLQAMLAPPVFALVLPDRMQGAAVIVQILSIAAFFQLVNQPTAELLKAQGRFHALMYISIAQAIAFLAAVVVGALMGEAPSVAWAVATYFAVTTPISTGIALVPSGRPLQFVGQIFWFPLVSCTVLALLLLSISALPFVEQRLWVQLLLPLATLLPLYVVMLAAVQGGVLEELRLLMRSRSHWHRDNQRVD